MLKRILKYTVGLLIIALGSGIALGYYHQDRMLQYFVQEANRYLTAPVAVEKISLSFLSSFPRMSVALHKVEIPGHQTDRPLANVDNIDFSFDLWSLLQGEYVIDRVALRHGEVYLHVDQEGQRNFDIFRPADTTHISSGGNRPPLAFRLQRITLDEIQVDYVDDPLQHHTDLLAQQAEATLEVEGPLYNVQLQGDLLCQGVQVEQSRYFAQKPLQVDAQLTYDHQNLHWQIAPSTVQLAQGAFTVSGELDHADGTALNLAVDGQETDVQTLLSLLPPEMARPLQAYRSQGTVYFEGTLRGDMPRPRVEVQFGCRDASLYHPDYQKQLQHISLTGSFTNGDQHNLRTAELSLQNIESTLDHKSIRGSLLIRDFHDHYLEAQIKTNVDVQSVLEFYPIADVQQASGQVEADITLAGKLSDMRSRRLANRQRTQSSGSLTLHDFHVQLKQYPLPFRKLEGNFMFQNNDVAISDFAGYVGHSHFKLNGLLRNAIAYVLSETQPIQIEADLYSSLADLDELLSGKLNESAPAAASAQAVQRDWQTITQKQPYRFYLDPRLSLDFNCQIDRLKFRRFKGKNLRSRLDVDHQIARIRNLSVEAGGGTASASGTIYAQRAQRINVRAESQFEGIKADSLFYIFEDFQQDFLTARHLKGSIFAEVDWLMNFDRALHLDYPSLQVTADAKIANGELNNFAPMQEIAQFVEDENLSQLRFGELRNKIRIADEKIYIPSMEVHNNVSSIRVQGVHTFTNHLDYQFEMPMQNIHLRSDRARQRAQQRKKDFGEIAPDDAKPMTLFLTAQGSVSDYKIAYDFEKAKIALKENLKEEKQERKAIFKNKGRKANYQVELEEEYFDFDN